MMDINEVVGALQIDAFNEVIKAENARIKANGGGAFFKSPRRIMTNVNLPIATTDVAPSISSPRDFNIANRVTADVRDQNPLYRQPFADGGLTDQTSLPGNILRCYFGLSVVFRPLVQTPANRLDTIQSLDSSMFRIKKGDVEEARFFGPQFLDMGPSAGADGASTATSLVVPSVDRRCAPIRPGIVFGKDEIPLMVWSHRRTAAWSAAFELDFYLLGLEARVNG